VEFFKKNKIKLLMLSPLVLGFLFFIVSAISAYYTVQTTVMPKDFKEVSLNITDYEIQQIDEKTNSVKWILKSQSAKASSDESQATVIKPQIKFYDKGSEKFTIEAGSADLDKANQKIVLYENVTLKTFDKSIEIISSKMLFSEENPFVEFSDNWQVTNDKGYIIAGERGKLSKGKDLIISEGNASIKKLEDQLNLQADSITLELKSDIPVKARSNAVLNIGLDKKLFASSIDIKSNGALNASGAVKVVTPSIQCYSSNMVIIPKPNKNPKTAIFTGNPFVIQDGSKLYADKIEYDFDSGEAHLLGSVHSG
jgi:LPS export ABC transporter protein LptC